MTTFNELLLNAVVSGLTVVSVLLIRRSLKKDNPHHKGTLPWDRWCENNLLQADLDSYGYECPKCHNVSKNVKKFPICLCEEYSEPHFHFKCGECSYEGILRTADDK